MPFNLDSIANNVAQRPIYSWLETAAICIAAVVLGLVVSPDDPFFTRQGSFPWTLLAPLLIGLRYGFLQAFVAALLLIIANYILVLFFEQAQWQFSTAASLGMLLSAMLTGEFRDIWERRINRLGMSNEYRQARLEEFTRNYHVLKLSHDQLEQESAGQTRSLRSALMEVQQQSLGEINQTAARSVLALYKHYCMAQVAGFYRVNKAGSVQREPLAAIGNIGFLDIDDPLVAACLEEKSVVSVASLHVDESMRSRYVVMIPFIDSSAGMHGVLAIKTLPFMALDKRNLRLMAILAGRLADCIFFGNKDHQHLDSDTSDFFRQLNRVLFEAGQHQLDSSLLVLNLKDQLLAGDIAGSEKRGLDLLWETKNREGHHCQLLLMPLSGKDGLARFRLRYEDRLRDQYRTDLQALGIGLASFAITEDTSAEAVTQFLTEVVQLPDDLASLCQQGGAR
jgi:hypothetical protein